MKRFIFFFAICLLFFYFLIKLGELNVGKVVDKHIVYNDTVLISNSSSIDIIPPGVRLYYVEKTDTIIKNRFYLKIHFEKKGSIIEREVDSTEYYNTKTGIYKQY